MICYRYDILTLKSLVHGKYCLPEQHYFSDKCNLWLVPAVKLHMFPGGWILQLPLKEINTQVQSDGNMT